METARPPVKRLVLRCVLKDVSPLVARVIAVPDDLDIRDLHDLFLAMLDWDYSPDFIIRVHAQEFASFRRNSRGKRLRDFQLRRQEKFLYICDTLDLWEWEVRVLDVEAAKAGEEVPVCLKGRGAAPPPMCGGPTGYRLMLRRQQAGPGLSNPAFVSASVKRLAEAYEDELQVDLRSLKVLPRTQQLTSLLPLIHRVSDALQFGDSCPHAVAVALCVPHAIRDG